MEGSKGSNMDRFGGMINLSQVPNMDSHVPESSNLVLPAASQSLANS